MGDLSDFQRIEKIKPERSDNQRKIEQAKKIRKIMTNRSKKFLHLR
jgi:hypothetical protein